MAGPSQLGLCKQGGDARQIGLAEDLSVWDSVLPFDFQLSSYAAQMEMAERDGETVQVSHPYKRVGSTKAW